MIIAISGHNRLGKSTLANYLKHNYEKSHTVIKKSFAENLRSEIYKNFNPDWIEEKSSEARRLLRAWGDARRVQNSMYFVNPIINALKNLNTNFVVIIDDVYHVNEFFYLNTLPNVKNIFVETSFFRLDHADLQYQSVLQTETITKYINTKDMQVLLDVDKNIDYTTAELANFVKNTQNIYRLEHSFTGANNKDLDLYMQKFAENFYEENNEK